MLAGQAIVGGSASLIVTVKLQVAVIPAASVTTNVLVVIPTGNVAPLGRPAVCAVVAPAQLSVPTGATNATIAPQTPGSLFVEMLAGQAIVGG